MVEFGFCFRYERTGVPMRHMSQGEHEFICFLKHEDPSIVTAYDSEGLEMFTGNRAPDAYSREMCIAYYYHGCFVRKFKTEFGTNNNFTIFLFDLVSRT